MLLRLRLVEQAQAELDRVIAAACEPWRHQIELLQTIPGVGEKVAQVPGVSPDAVAPCSRSGDSRVYVEVGDQQNSSGWVNRFMAFKVIAEECVRLR